MCHSPLQVPCHNVGVGSAVCKSSKPLCVTTTTTGWHEASTSDRLQQLNTIAIVQLRSLLASTAVKRLTAPEKK
ncbi:MAG: hypothetical protein AUK47_14435 [Deltaproteobacteria bacterium CG2_30_63_29]|nr:MAG: hypothetical protein AUK47_14435 [Deltaproteobacteria bacterium CG2_30_63_29]PIW00979.1 MAG: hypothetical protein COW42_06275 [Deltaproteobacteria bacterium CG17_big_fil_post_rev_8_21_14_2_50_63_7]PJB48671.1 MAG: hypothetical protein CO108_02060 [Deltaproteobacteria bacterium CG_4_9_14_3_um_filter_63_12]